MNRRGVAILLLSAIALFVAVILFFASVDKMNVVGNSTFLGENEALIAESFAKGEGLLTFLETAALASVKGDDFTGSFSGYLDKANEIFGTDIKIEDYNFVRTDSSLKAVCLRSFVLERANVKYSVTPSFIVHY